MRTALKNSDNVGILSSTLCFIHCLITPFIYITYAGFFKQSEYLSFSWKGVNLVFIIFSLIAVNRSTKNISAQIIDDTKNITLVSASSNSKEIKQQKKTKLD